MNIKTLISTLLALSIAASGLAFGQPNNRGSNDELWRRGQQDRRDHAEMLRHRQGNQERWERNDHRNDYRNDYRGAGPNHDFHRGDRLPSQYRSRHYVVEDWRGHRLSAPPRGYHWVQTGGDYVLVAITTGIILQLLLNN